MPDEMCSYPPVTCMPAAPPGPLCRMFRSSFILREQPEYLLHHQHLLPLRDDLPEHDTKLYKAGESDSLQPQRAAAPYRAGAPIAGSFAGSAAISSAAADRDPYAEPNKHSGRRHSPEA